MNWLRYSGIWVTLICNPYHWRVSFSNQSDWPDTKEYVLQVVFVSVRVVIDNGQY
jgi:hypothetical protein